MISFLSQAHRYPTFFLGEETLPSGSENRKIAICAIGAIGISGSYFYLRKQSSLQKTQSVSSKELPLTEKRTPLLREPPYSTTDWVPLNPDWSLQVPRGYCSPQLTNCQPEPMEKLAPITNGFQENSFGITSDRRYVLQQQGRDTSSATSLVMILLDRELIRTRYKNGEKPPEIVNEVQHGYTGRLDGFLGKILDLGLRFEIVEIKENELDLDLRILLLRVENNKPVNIPNKTPEEKIKALEGCLERHGSGIVVIDHPQLRRHHIALDSISGNFITVRDPFHGYSFKVSEQEFLTWNPLYCISLKRNN